MKALDLTNVTATQGGEFPRVTPGGYVIGIVAVVLGILGLRNPLVAADTLSALISIGIILLGVSYLVAVLGINKLQKALGK